MKHISALLVLFCLLALGAGMGLAQESGARSCTDSASDGSGLPLCFTPADNECYAGGTMAGKCDNAWTWIGGWLMARFNRGLIPLAEFPAEWASLLPKPLISESVASNGTCSYEYDVATGKATIKTAWTPIAGQQNHFHSDYALVRGLFEDPNPIFPDESILDYDFSFDKNPSERMLWAKVSILDASDKVLLVINCVVTNINIPPA